MLIYNLSDRIDRLFSNETHVFLKQTTNEQNETVLVVEKHGYFWNLIRKIDFRIKAIFFRSIEFNHPYELKKMFQSGHFCQNFSTTELKDLVRKCSASFLEFICAQNDDDRRAQLLATSNKWNFLSIDLLETLDLNLVDEEYLKCIRVYPEADQLEANEKLNSLALIINKLPKEAYSKLPPKAKSNLSELKRIVAIGDNFSSSPDIVQANLSNIFNQNPNFESKNGLKFADIIKKFQENEINKINQFLQKMFGSDPVTENMKDSLVKTLELLSCDLIILDEFENSYFYLLNWTFLHSMGSQQKLHKLFEDFPPQKGKASSFLKWITKIKNLNEMFLAFRDIYSRLSSLDERKKSIKYFSRIPVNKYCLLIDLVQKNNVPEKNLLQFIKKMSVEIANGNITLPLKKDDPSKKAELILRAKTELSLSDADAEIFISTQGDTSFENLYDTISHLSKVFSGIHANIFASLSIESKIRKSGQLSIVAKNKRKQVVNQMLEKFDKTVDLSDSEAIRSFLGHFSEFISDALIG